MQDLETLIHILKTDPTIVHRRIAAMELSQSPDKRAVPALIDALGDHEDVEIFATLALVRIGNEAVPELLKAIERPLPQLRSGVVEILGELAPKEALDKIIELIHHDPDINVRQDAVEALGRFTQPKAQAELENIMKLDDPILIVPAALALSKQKPKKRILERLLELLVNANQSEKGKIVWALIEIADRSLLPLFHEFLENHGDDTELTELVSTVITGISSR